MAKSRETFQKRLKEKKRRERKMAKKEKLEQRRAENESGGKSLQDMIAYVDEDGNLTETPPEGVKI
ncbi:MAG TPA: hypothetical protein VFS31_04585 [Chitinophagaceae bacterium]|jgi:hypothetical protein|nr:hypothetical protein [Chitinophagaceae bacterium]